MLKQPALPPPERMPVRRQARGPSPGARALAAVAGVALGVTAGLGLFQALRDPSGRSSPFMPLALLIPTAVLIRFALTGAIRLN